MHKYTNRARHLRHHQTDAERQLWSQLRDRNLTGHKFRRQHIIGHYIADFVCIEKKLIIELDGSQHMETMLYDKKERIILSSWATVYYVFGIMRFSPNSMRCWKR